MTHIVEIQDMAYSPASITIEVGDDIIWTNKDGMAHTATRKNSPTFDTGSILTNSNSVAIKFEQISGNEGFEYFCKPHKFMTGKIIVQ